MGLHIYVCRVLAPHNLAFSYVGCPNLWVLGGRIPFDESIAACRKQPDAVYDFPQDDWVVLEKRICSRLVCSTPAAC